MKAQKPTEISVLSYNILADCYVRVAGQPWNAFAHCSEEHLDSQNRIVKIQQILQESKADVICLQEVVFEKRKHASTFNEEWTLPAWTDIFQGEYTCVMQGLSQKEWEKNAERNARMVGKPTPTGVASFFLNERWCEAEPARHGSGSGSVLYLRSRVDPQCQVAIGNTHLVGDPQKADGQLKQLSGIEKNLAKCPQFARLICGDMNGECAESSAVGHWVRQQVVTIPQPWPCAPPPPSPAP